MAAPPDSAFIRVVNLTGDQLDLGLDEWRQSLAPGRAGDYLYRPGGEAQIRINGKSFDFSFASRSVQTLIFDGQSMRLHEDTYFNSRLKALLVMYNLTGQGASLQTANGSVTVIGPLAAEEGDGPAAPDVRAAVARAGQGTDDKGLACAGLSVQEDAAGALKRDAGELVAVHEREEDRLLELADHVPVAAHHLPPFREDG